MNEEQKKTAPEMAVSETESRIISTGTSIPKTSEKVKTPYRSRVYTDRPDYADLPSAEKFQAIQGIIMTRLKQHPSPKPPAKPKLLPSNRRQPPKPRLAA